MIAHRCFLPRPVWLPSSIDFSLIHRLTIIDGVLPNVILYSIDYIFDWTELKRDSLRIDALFSFHFAEVAEDAD